MTIQTTGKFKPNNPSFKQVEDIDVEITPTYTGNLVGKTSQKEVNDVIDGLTSSSIIITVGSWL